MIPEEAVEAAAPWITNFLERRGLVLRGKEADVLAGYVLKAAAPHLVAREFSPTRWWRAIAPDGSLLAETSATDDFTHLDLIDNPGVTFQRLYEEVPASVWRDETP